MDELADDLLLLGVRADGTLRILGHLRFGLAGSELVRLAAAGRVNVVHGRIEVLRIGPTGDPLLDDALASMISRHEPTAKSWVADDRRGLVERYLARAESAGIIRADRRKVLGFIPATRWTVVDTGRAAQARARLEAVAASTGAVNSAQVALAGLATAIGVTGFVFPGFAGGAARKRLRQAATSDTTSHGTARAVHDAASAANAAAAGASVWAATDAAARAATDAAIDAATHAAVSAATDAASHAASHGGATGHAASHGGATGHAASHGGHHGGAASHAASHGGHGGAAGGHH